MLGQLEGPQYPAFKKNNQQDNQCDLFHTQFSGEVICPVQN